MTALLLRLLLALCARRSLCIQPTPLLPSTHLTLRLPSPIYTSTIRPCPALLLQLLARQRIPSGQYSDPLGHIFSEFDRDKDGSLTALEVAEALRSRNVDITDEQAGERVLLGVWRVGW